MSLAVVIPNFNKEKYISDCINSILSQSYAVDEIIIVDDCSTDNSRSIIQKYADEHTIIKPVYLQKNGGVSHARNVGIKTATSEYVTFLDSDDFYYNTDKLKNEMNAIEKSGENSLAYSITVKVDENGTVIGKGLGRWRYLSGNLKCKLIANYKNIAKIPRDYCVRRNAVLSCGGYTESRKLFEDSELSIKLAKIGTHFVFSGEYGTAYRALSTGLSSQDKALVDSEFNKMRMNFFRELSLYEKTKVMLLTIAQFIRRVMEYISRRIGHDPDYIKDVK